MRKYIVVSLFALTFVGGFVPSESPAASRENVCYEDEPCFRWSRDGNVSRGVVIKKKYRTHVDLWIGNDPITVVTRCQFQRLWYARKIDRKRTEPLKGDGYARRYGCGRDIQNY